MADESTEWEYQAQVGKMHFTGTIMSPENKPSMALDEVVKYVKKSGMPETAVFSIDVWPKAKKILAVSS